MKNTGQFTSGQATEEISTAGMFELHGGCLMVWLMPCDVTDTAANLVPLSAKVYRGKGVGIGLIRLASCWRFN